MSEDTYYSQLNSEDLFESEPQISDNALPETHFEELPETHFDEVPETQFEENQEEVSSEVQYNPPSPENETELNDENELEIQSESETQFNPAMESETQFDENESPEVQTGKSSTERLIKLPLSRIKSIMKMDPDVNITSQEAVFLVAKATELFIQSLTRETYGFTLKSKKKTMQRKDLDAAIETIDSLSFLEGTID